MLDTGLLLQALANIEARTPVTDNSGDMGSERGKHNPDQGMPKFERQVKKPWPREEDEVPDPTLVLVDRQAGTINYETSVGSGVAGALDLTADPEHRSWMADLVNRNFNQ